MARWPSETSVSRRQWLNSRIRESTPAAQAAAHELVSNPAAAVAAVEALDAAQTGAAATRSERGGRRLTTCC